MKGLYRRLVPDGLVFLLPIFAAVHACFMIYDIHDPELFLNGDRARYRIEVVSGFVGALTSRQGVIDYLATHGLLGDYAFHGLAYAVDQSTGVILLQVIACLISLVYVYKLALLVSFSRGAAQVATIAYFLLPHTLTDPHLLVTESLSNPLTIGALYHLFRFLSTQNPNPVDAWLSALLIGVSTLVRPVVILFPLIAALLILLQRQGVRRSAAAGYLGIAAAPVLLWMSFLLVTTGSFMLGSSGSSLSVNLFLKTQRMVTSAPGLADESIVTNREEKTVSPRDYVDFIAKHPRLLVKMTQYDLGNLLMNSGINKLMAYYFHVYDANVGQSEAWGAIIDREGILAGIRSILRESRCFLVFTIAGAALWACVLFGAAVGYYLFLKDVRHSLAARLLLIAYPVYVIVWTVAVVSYPRSGHRSSFESLICIMFAILVLATHNRFWRKRSG